MVTQTLYPRVLQFVSRSVKTCGFFSLDFEERDDGLHFFVRSWDQNRVFRVCVCVEPLGQSFPEAELRCLSRFLSCVGVNFRPLMMSGVSSLVCSFYNDANKKRGKLLSYVEYNQETFKTQVQRLSGLVFGLVDPFTLLEFLVWKLRPARDETWMLPLTAFRACLRKGSVDFKELPAVLPELLSVWNLIREQLGATVSKAVTGSTVEVMSFSIIVIIFFSFYVNFTLPGSWDCRSDLFRPNLAHAIDILQISDYYLLVTCWFFVFIRRWVLG